MNHTLFRCLVLQDLRVCSAGEHVCLVNVLRFLSGYLFFYARSVEGPRLPHLVLRFSVAARYCRARHSQLLVVAHFAYFAVLVPSLAPTQGLLGARAGLFGGLSVVLSDPPVLARCKPRLWRAKNPVGRITVSCAW